MKAPARLIIARIHLLVCIHWKARECIEKLCRLCYAEWGRRKDSRVNSKIAIFSGSSFEALHNCRVVRVYGDSCTHTAVPPYSQCYDYGQELLSGSIGCGPWVRPLNLKPGEMKAPAPQKPEASAVMEGPLGKCGNRPVPFQTSMYVRHQAMSAMHFWSNLVRWFAAFRQDMASIRLLMKGLQVRTTGAASHSRPMSTCRMQTFCCTIQLGCSLSMPVLFTGNIAL